MKFSILAASLALAGALSVAAPAQAIVLTIDDWNLTTGDSVTDTTVGGHVVQQRDTSTGGTSLTRGDFMANLVAGDGVSTIDCANCQQGHFINDANSTGHGYWQWTASSLDLSGFSSIMLDFGTDVPGADMILSFGNQTGLIGEIWWKDLADTNLVMTTLMAALPAGLTDVDLIYLDAFSVGGSYTDPTGWLGTRDYGQAATSLDLNVDNLKAVPEPATLALLGAGLLGLGMSRRRKQ